MKKFIAVVLASVLCSAPVLAQQVLKVAVNEGSKNYQPALAALYKEVGLTAQFVVLPSERALKSVESGEVDADLGRVAGGIAGYQNMLETTEPLSEISLIALVKKGSPITKLTVPELKARKVGVMRGTKIAEGVLAKLGVEPTVVNTQQQLYQMLANDRFEVALLASTMVVGSDISGTMTALPPLMTAKAVHVLHSKWAALAPKIDAALKAMKADGRWAKLVAAP